MWARAPLITPRRNPATKPRPLRYQVRQLGEARQQRGRLLPSSFFGGRSRGGDVAEGRGIAQAQLQQLEVRRMPRRTTSRCIVLGSQHRRDQPRTFTHGRT